MVNTWRDEDEDGAWGLGMLFDVRPPDPKVAKSNPRNRYQRPVSSWKPVDVAMEFRTRVEEMAPALTGYLTGKRNVIMLGATRKRLKTTPEIELALMDLFLAEEREVRAITAHPTMAYRFWIATWTRNMDRARAIVEASGTAPAAPESPKAPIYDYGGQLLVSGAPVDAVGSLSASDGTTFPDTPLGAKRLAKYEAYLKENK